MITVDKLIEHLTNMAKQGKGSHPVMVAAPVGQRIFPLERGDTGKISADGVIIPALVLYPNVGLPTIPGGAIPMIGAKK